MINLDKTLYKIVKYEKNEVIKNQGDECNSIALIISGTVKIINITFYQDEYVIDTLKSNDFFGENLIFSKNNKYPGIIVSQTQTHIAYIEKNIFLNLLSSNEEFKLFYLTYISNKFINLQIRLKILSQPTIEEKIIYYLQINENNGSTYIKNISELATYFNIPRPSLSRSLSKLIKQGVIIKNNKLYKLN